MLDYTKLQKHELHKMPDMSKLEYKRLKASIKKSYDDRFPIIIFRNRDTETFGVIDGWHRLQASIETNQIPLIVEFSGTIREAMNYIIATMERRETTEDIYLESKESMKLIAKELKLDESKSEAKVKASHSGTSLKYNIKNQ